MINVKIKKLHPDARIPQYQTDGAGCFDLHALESGEIGACGGVLHCRTGIAVEIPSDHVMLIFSRSGHGFKSRVSLVNSVGVIDSDYRGDITVGLRNDSPLRFDVPSGSRIAQAMVIYAPRASFTLTDDLADTARGAGGFGSTGTDSK